MCRWQSPSLTFPRPEHTWKSQWLCPWCQQMVHVPECACQNTNSHCWVPQASNLICEWVEELNGSVSHYLCSGLQLTRGGYCGYSKMLQKLEKLYILVKTGKNWLFLTGKICHSGKDPLSVSPKCLQGCDDIKVVLCNNQWGYCKDA